MARSIRFSHRRSGGSSPSSPSGIISRTARRRSFSGSVGSITTSIILDIFWPSDDPDPSYLQLLWFCSFAGLFVLWLMWVADPDGILRRTKSILPLDLDGEKIVAVVLLIGFLVCTVIAHRLFERFEQRYFRTVALSYAGLTLVHGLLPSGHVLHSPATLIAISAIGFFGTDLPRVIMSLLSGVRRHTGVFGQARFEDKRSEAEKAGLKKN